MKYSTIAISLCIGTLLYHGITDRDWATAFRTCYFQATTCWFCYALIEKPWRKWKCLN